MENLFNSVSKKWLIILLAVVFVFSASTNIVTQVKASSSRYKIVLKYVDKDTQESIAPETSVYNTLSKSYTYAPKTIDGYTFVDIKVSRNSTTETIVFEYKSNGDVVIEPPTEVILGSITVKYIDIDTKSELLTSEVNKDLELKDYTYSAKSISGYTVVGGSSKTITITNENLNQTITFEYKKDVVVTLPTSISSSKLKNLLVYYGYPSCVGNAKSLTEAINIYKNYDLIVFPDDVSKSSHGDHNNTISIISSLKSSKPGVELFGYVPIGQINASTMLTLDQMKTKVQEWKVMGVTGIFLDEFGFDYKVTRQLQNDIVTYCHNNGLNVMVNSWEIDYVFKKEDIKLDWLSGFDPNPNNLVPVVNGKDYSMFESMFYNYDSSAGVQRVSTTSRIYDAYKYNNVPQAAYGGLTYKQKFGTKTVALDEMENNYHYFTVGYIGSKVLGIDGYGASYKEYANENVVVYPTPNTVIDNLSGKPTVSSSNGIANAKFILGGIEFIWQNGSTQKSLTQGIHEVYFNGTKINTLDDLPKN